MATKERIQSANAMNDTLRTKSETVCQLREDEEFAITSLATAFSATWRPGENPPDAYLILGASAVAVEISTLTQYVTDGKGTRPRLSDDLATAAFANVLDDELKNLIPNGYTIGLVLSSPILSLRKTRAKLAQILRTHIADLASLETDRKIQINGNDITIYLNHHGEKNFRKVSAAFLNRSSNPNVLSNVTQILEDRITTKARKCDRLQEPAPIWLALLNDYWLTDADTYRYALSRLSLEHPFEKILLVNGDRSVSPLYEG
jgi:hypothetical protein